MCMCVCVRVRVNCWSHASITICFNLLNNMQGDYPCTVSNGPTKRPQYMRISRPITVTHLFFDVLFAEMAWG